ncbi:MAG: hypothetical protein ACREQL_12855 [Candidatus Binatia bacterium]
MDLVRIVQATATRAVDGVSLATLARSLLPELARVYEEREALTVELDTLRARLTDLEVRGNEQRRALEALVVREQERIRTLAQDLERGEAEREETLRLARESVQTAEEARARAVAELETVRATLAAEQRRLVDIQHDRAQATQGAAEREADLVRARAVIAQLEASRAETAAELERARATLARNESEILDSQHEYQLAQVLIEKVSGGHDDLVESCAQLLAKNKDANERESRLRLHVTSLEERVRSLQGESGHPQNEQGAGEAAELAQARERQKTLESELANAKAAASAATMRATQAQDALAAARAEVASLKAAVPATEPGPAGAIEVPHDPVIEFLAPDPDDAPEPVVAPCRIAVLDANEGWEAPAGIEVHRVEPGPDACDRLRELDPACCLVDLAAPGTLEAAAALRAAKVTAPLWGCAVGGTGTHAVPLGVIDVVPRPVDPLNVGVQLATLAPTGAKVVMVGSDGSALIPLREGLAQGGMSVRTAWNLKQAGELIDGVRPNVVIIDLASESGAAAEFVVALARRESAPLIVVIPGPPRQLEEFVAALAAIATTSATAGRSDLVRAAATALTKTG